MPVMPLPKNAFILWTELKLVHLSYRLLHFLLGRIAKASDFLLQSTSFVVCLQVLLLPWLKVQLIW